MEKEIIGTSKERALPMPVDYWINVKDLLPKDVGLDWVQVQTVILPEGYWGVPETAEMRDGTWYSIEDTVVEQKDAVIVTHWRLLPAPPEDRAAGENS